MLGLVAAEDARAPAPAPPPAIRLRLRLQASVCGSASASASGSGSDLAVDGRFFRRLEADLVGLAPLPRLRVGLLPRLTVRAPPRGALPAAPRGVYPVAGFVAIAAIYLGVPELLFGGGVSGASGGGTRSFSPDVATRSIARSRAATHVPSSGAFSFLLCALLRPLLSASEPRPLLPGRDLPALPRRSGVRVLCLLTLLTFPGEVTSYRGGVRRGASDRFGCAFRFDSGSGSGFDFVFFFARAAEGRSSAFLRLCLGVSAGLPGSSPQTNPVSSSMPTSPDRSLSKLSNILFKSSSEIIATVMWPPFRIAALNSVKSSCPEPSLSYALNSLPGSWPFAP